MMMLGKVKLARMMALGTISRREARELARAAAIRRRIRSLVHPATDRPARTTLFAIVDALRTRYGVEAVCAELSLAPQDYYAEKSRAAEQRWRRLFSGPEAQRRAGSRSTTNSRPTGICTLEASSAAPTV